MYPIRSYFQTPMEKVMFPEKCFFFLKLSGMLLSFPLIFWKSLNWFCLWDLLLKKLVNSNFNGSSFLVGKTRRLVFDPKTKFQNFLWLLCKLVITSNPFWSPWIYAMSKLQQCECECLENKMLLLNLPDIKVLGVFSK